MRQKPVPQTSSAEKTIKDIRRATRKHYSAENKIRIVLEGLRREDSIAAICRREARLSPDVVGTSSSLEEVRRMIITGLGIGPLPLHVARREIDDGLLWRLPPYDNPPAIDVFLIHNPEANLNKAEKAMLTGLKSIIASTPLEERIYQD